MLRNKPLLLTILAILVLARFVLVPLQQQQQAQYQQLDALTKRLQRSEALLQQKQKLALLQTEQQQYLNQLLQPFPVVANSSQYRLQLQQQLQKPLGKAICWLLATFHCRLLPLNECAEGPKPR